MHNKFVVFDGRDTTSSADDWVWTGSWNVTESGTYSDMQNVPGWAKTFNGSGWIQKNVPLVWEKLKPEAVYAKYGPDELEGEEVWDGSTSFPHRMEEKKVISRFFSTPWGNTYLLDFARTAMTGENLGARGVTDLLCISLSTTDAIGSESGPNSHEMLDNLLRLALDLGAFLVDLEKAFGRGEVLFVLGGDHGVMQLPEYLSKVERVTARRFNNRSWGRQGTQL